MRFSLLGLNHRTADVALRERAGFGARDLAAGLDDLRRRFPECEAVLLSTCNRTEFYIARPGGQGPDADTLRAWWAQRRSVSQDELAAVTLEREQASALKHLFRVAGGLDSRVVGEPEVQFQVRRAYDEACQTGTVGPVMHQVFQNAIASARRARRDTGLGRQGASVGSVALQFTRSVFESLENKTVACVGTGEIAKATLRRMLRHNPRQTWIVNRTPANARDLAAALNIEPQQGGARPWDHLDTVLVEADVLVCATGAEQPIVTATAAKPLIRKRRGRPLVVLDLAVPRDVEETVGGLANVFLYNIDDLCEVVDHDPKRHEAIRACEQSMAADAATCFHQLQHRDVGQLVRQLRHKMQALADEEQQRSVRKAEANLDPEQLARVEQVLGELGHRLVNKFLHLPLQQLDTKRDDGALGFYAAALRRLFELDDTPTPPTSKDDHAQEAQAKTANPATPKAELADRP